jgi:hypothetical protein
LISATLRIIPHLIFPDTEERVQIGWQWPLFGVHSTITGIQGTLVRVNESLCKTKMSNQFVESLQLQEEQDGLKVEYIFLNIIQLFLKGPGCQMNIF